MSLNEHTRYIRSRNFNSDRIQFDEIYDRPTVHYEDTIANIVERTA